MHKLIPLLSLSSLALTIGCSDSTGSQPPSTTSGGNGVGGTGAVATGATSGGPSGGAPSGGAPVTGGTATGGALAGTGGAVTGTGGLTGPGSYALPPPSQCHSEDWVEGCIAGDPSTPCGGVCNTINACLEDTASKPGADVAFICPRFMLFSDPMQQAAVDDGNSAFNYAVAGHDVDVGGVDGTAQSSCCQCYQLVYAYPSPDNERQVQLNPDDTSSPASAIPLPKPLIVQSFNTAATPTTFDIYMAAGGLGANNACAPNLQPASRSGQYLYSSYPEVGQPSNGGVKPVTHFTECKNSYQWVTTDTLSSAACQTKVADACNQLSSSIPGLTDQARRSCIDANKPDSCYHLNWSVYVKKVECPAHLTEVTGCKLAPQGLPPVDPNVTTAAQAASDPSFLSTSTSGKMYETTTMEDCCRPSCAAKDTWIVGKGLTTDPQYNAFYSCDANGAPFTE